MSTLPNVDCPWCGAPAIELDDTVRGAQIGHCECCSKPVRLDEYGHAQRRDRREPKSACDVNGMIMWDDE